MRRILALGLGLTLLAAGIGWFYWSQSSHAEAPAGASSARLLVLGIDGMDATLLKEFMAAGKLPNFSRVAAQGTFSPLGTSMPPQSPVAWSNMISGADPGTHQIYDFIHRDPDPREDYLAIKPYLSTSDVVTPEESGALELGKWQIPLSLTGEQTRLLRRGPAFWDALSAARVKSVIYRMPANYPPPDVTSSAYCTCLCGMGTPDIVGSYGIFTLFTPDAPLGGSDVSGGRLEHWEPLEHRAVGKLTGPGNPLLKPEAEGEGPPEMTVEFEVVRDPEADVARIEIQGTAAILKQGEWSEWLPIAFETGIPGSTVLDETWARTSVPCMVRFYLKEVHPKLQVYVTPLNIDPQDPVNPISTPVEFSSQLAERSGRYYTTGIPEDTKALRENAFNEDEFLAQARLVLDERIAQYRTALEDFDTGCLFFYFGTVDQLSHMFWRDRDPQHPGRVQEQEGKYQNVIEDSYVEMDGLLGEALATLDDDDTLIVMSDHGFTGFRRGFNLNSWLVENGYITVFSGTNRDEIEMFMYVDWSKSRAYGLGLNGLYLNLKGREKNGIVEPGSAADALLTEISNKLLEMRDTDGSPVIERVYRTSELYQQADPNIAPDLLIGYARNYRASWATALGGMPYALLEDNDDRWSGDHCNAQDVVPGIIVTNRKLTASDPQLSDVGPTILGLFGIEPQEGMTGRQLLGSGTTSDNSSGGSAVQ